MDKIFLPNSYVRFNNITVPRGQLKQRDKTPLEAILSEYERRHAKSIQLLQPTTTTQKIETVTQTNTVLISILQELNKLTTQPEKIAYILAKLQEPVLNETNKKAYLEALAIVKTGNFENMANAAQLKLDDLKEILSALSITSTDMNLFSALSNDNIDKIKEDAQRYKMALIRVWFIIDTSLNQNLAELDRDQYNKFLENVDNNKYPNLEVYNAFTKVKNVDDLRNVLTMAVDPNNIVDLSTEDIDEQYREIITIPTIEIINDPPVYHGGNRTNYFTDLFNENPRTSRYTIENPEYLNNSFVTEALGNLEDLTKNILDANNAQTVKVVEFAAYLVNSKAYIRENGQILQLVGLPGNSSKLRDQTDTEILETLKQYNALYLAGNLSYSRDKVYKYVGERLVITSKYNIQVFDDTDRKLSLNVQRIKDNKESTLLLLFDNQPDLIKNSEVPPNMHEFLKAYRTIMIPLIN